MLTRARGIVAVLIVAVLASPTLAQTVAAPAAPAAPQAGGLVGMCQLIDAKIKECKKKICECPLGQMLTNMGKIVNTYAGGMLCPPCCPEVKEDDLKKGSNTPQGACARIRQEEAEAPDRRAAVRCLAYADCNWYPEAEAALITALRTDRNECVRYEAACVMGTGCCCTRKTIQALATCASSSKKDGNPPENSMRVKAAAYASLQHCIHNFAEVEVIDPLPQPETPDRLPDPRKLPLAVPPAAPGTTAFQMIEPTVALRPVPVAVDPLIAEARAVLAEQKVAVTEQPGMMQTGQRSIYDAFVRASAPMPVLSAAPSTAPGATTTEPPLEKKPRSLFEWMRGRNNNPPSPPPVLTRPEEPAAPQLEANAPVDTLTPVPNPVVYPEH